MRYAVAVLIVASTLVGCHGPYNNGLPPAGSLLHKNVLPPADMLMHPGPGVDGPGPGVMVHQPCAPSPAQASQINFVGPDGMAVAWDVSMAGQFDSEPLICPGRYNFPQGAIYRLKLSNIPGRPGVELYPTLEVGPVMPRTAAFLSHNPIPVQFTEEDFDQVLSNNFVTKVIYLPDPDFQDMAVAGVETLVSTRLDPGVDPIVEADRRGSIMAIVRVGNLDLETPGAGGNMDGVVPASYSIPCESNGMVGGPQPMGMNMGGTVPQPYISGVTGPEYGMPMCGTPIGLPGPPHVPLGIPAGLQKHVVTNHTKVHMPDPVRKMSIDVKQTPGLSYPKPVNHISIREHTSGGLGVFRQPLSDKCQCVGPGCEGMPCEGECEGYSYEDPECSGPSDECQY